MKIFGCVDLTANKKNTTHSGEEFVVATPSPALADALNQSTENLMALEKKAALPAPIVILQILCFFIGACCFMGLLRADVPVQVAYQNAPWVFWAGGICLILWGILLAIGKVKKKKVMGSDEGQQTAEHFEGVTNSIWNEYGVPNYALDVDVLSFCFKQKNGQIKPVTKASATTLTTRGPIALTAIRIICIWSISTANTPFRLSLSAVFGRCKSGSLFPAGTRF